MLPDNAWREKEGSSCMVFIPELKPEGLFAGYRISIPPVEGLGTQDLV